MRHCFWAIFRIDKVTLVVLVLGEILGSQGDEYDNSAFWDVPSCIIVW